MRHEGVGNDRNQTTRGNYTASAKSYNSMEPSDDNITKMWAVRPGDHAPQKKKLGFAGFRSLNLCINNISYNFQCNFENMVHNTGLDGLG